MLGYRCLPCLLHVLTTLASPPHFLDVAPGLPVAADAVPLLRRGNDDVSSQQRSQVRRVVACSQPHNIEHSTAQQERVVTRSPRGLLDTRENTGLPQACHPLAQNIVCSQQPHKVQLQDSGPSFQVGITRVATWQHMASQLLAVSCISVLQSILLLCRRVELGPFATSINTFVHFLLVSMRIYTR